MADSVTLWQTKGQEKQRGATFLQSCIPTSEAQEQVGASNSISFYGMINLLDATDKRLVAWRVTRFIIVKLGWGADIFRLKMLLMHDIAVINHPLCVSLVGNETLKTSRPESGNWCLKRNINQCENLLQTQPVVRAFCIESVYVFTHCKYGQHGNITRLFLTDT